MPRRRNNSDRPESAVYEILEADGGWLTADGISAAGGGRPSSITRSLQRWRHKGLVEARILELAKSGRGSGVETRQEWRIVTPGP